MGLPSRQPMVAPSRRFPRWPLLLLLGLSLLAAAAAWGLHWACRRVQLAPTLILGHGWLLVIAAAGLAIATTLAGLRTPQTRRAGFAGLLLLLLGQAILLGHGLLALNRQLRAGSRKGPYVSVRERVRASQRPADWPDPLQPECFDLGGGVRLAMPTVCFTDADLRTLPSPAPAAWAEPAADRSLRPLTPGTLANLVAFTRALGYIRFFHPSDQATEAPWHQVTILGIQAVENASGPQDLARRLQAFFAPLAPSVRFLAPGEPAARLQPPQGGTLLTRWRHHGLGPLTEPGRYPFSRSVGLADVATLWTVMQHFYPYFDGVAADWAGALPEALTQAAQAGDERSLLRTLRTLLATLRDGHGYVARATGTASPRPPVWLQLVAGRAYVKAARPELPPGSEVLAVDGEPVAERLTRLRREISAATEGWMASRLEFSLLSNCPGPSAALTLRTPQGQRREVQVALEPRQDPPARLAPLVELRPGIWYVDLDRIEAKPFHAALPTLAAAKGVLFDLRGYPRMGPEFLQHLTDRTMASPQWLVPIVTQPDRRGWAWDNRGCWRLEPLKPRFQGKLVFLTGAGAISYAESCLGIVEAYRLGEIVGESSAGTNGNVNTFQLPDGCRVTWTGMKVLKQDGSRHHGIGIQPTVPVRPTPQGLAQGRDEVLDRGLEVASR